MFSPNSTSAVILISILAVYSPLASLKWDAEKEEFIEKDSYPNSMDIQMWEEYSSNRDKVVKEAIARIQKK